MAGTTKTRPYNAQNAGALSLAECQITFAAANARVLLASLPAGAVGGVKRALEICREWSNERGQWGFPIGKTRCRFCSTICLLPSRRCWR